MRFHLFKRHLLRRAFSIMLQTMLWDLQLTLAERDGEIMALKLILEENSNEKATADQALPLAQEQEASVPPPPLHVTSPELPAVLNSTEEKDDASATSTLSSRSAATQAAHSSFRDEFAGLFIQLDDRFKRILEVYESDGEDGT